MEYGKVDKIDTGQSTDDIIVYNGTKWVPQAASAPAVTVAFLAQTQITNLAASFTVTYTQERFDVGNDLDYNGTGIFTAPVAGYYHLSSLCRFRQIQTSGVVTSQIQCTGSGATSLLNTSFTGQGMTGPLSSDISIASSGVVFLPSGGTALLLITTTGANTGVVDLDGGEFSGYLIGS
jgi:hypothetical protein